MRSAPAPPHRFTQITEAVLFRCGCCGHQHRIDAPDDSIMVETARARTLFHCGTCGHSALVEVVAAAPPTPSKDIPMTNLLRGEIAVGEGADALRLKLDVNALCALEEDGETLEALAKRAETGSLSALRRIVQALMQAHRPGATLQEAGDAMSRHGVQEVAEALGRLLSAQGSEAPAGNAPAPERTAAPAATG